MSNTVPNIMNHCNPAHYSQIKMVIDLWNECCQNAVYSMFPCYPMAPVILLQLWIRQKTTTNAIMHTSKMCQTPPPQISLKTHRLLWEGHSRRYQRLQQSACGTTENDESQIFCCFLMLKRTLGKTKKKLYTLSETKWQHARKKKLHL